MNHMEKHTKTPLRISTMVVTAHWGKKINLEKMFTPLKGLIIPIWIPMEGILKIELNNRVLGSCYKDIFTNRKMTKKSFFNQATIILRRRINKTDNADNADLAIATWKEVNVKLFANGGIQMTGVFSEEFALDSIYWLYKVIMNLPDYPFIDEPYAEEEKKEDAGDAGYAGDAGNVEEEKREEKDKSNFITRFSTQLINTDYSVNRFINQDAFHKILINEYNLFSMLEKTIYQGINTKFFYNTNNTTGICECSKFCKGQGSGEGDQQCKRITMSIFRTGKIIITGARTIQQINTAYDYLNKILDKHAATVLYDQSIYILNQNAITA
jgi:hypothetical protein